MINASEAPFCTSVSSFADMGVQETLETLVTQETPGTQETQETMTDSVSLCDLSVHSGQGYLELKQGYPVIKHRVHSG